MSQLKFRFRAPKDVIKDYVDVSFVVTGYSWRRYLGDYWPYIDYLYEGRKGGFILYGYHYLRFAGRFCRWCGSEEIVSDLGLCSKCYGSPNGIKYRVIVKGYEEVGDPTIYDLIADLLHYRYILYLGSFGSKLKVGISRLNRDGDFRGYLGRIIEQGLDSAVVFDGGYDLLQAQEMEKTISSDFGISQVIRFNEKLDELQNGTSYRDVRDVAEDILREYRDLSVIWFGRISWSEPRSFDHIWREDVIDGELIYARGNIAIFETGSKKIAVNLSSLAGRGIITEEL
ncbi:MAG: hypothetical protein Q6351_005020 [Candidatus Njordarchaeum guaymaensis]